MSSAHIADVYDVADLLDIRISTVRALCVDGSGILPEPLSIGVGSTGTLRAFWPMAVLQCWVAQGMPTHFEYDRDEFQELLTEQLQREESNA